MFTGNLGSSDQGFYSVQVWDSTITHSLKSCGHTHHITSKHCQHAWSHICKTNTFCSKQLSLHSLVINTFHFLKVELWTCLQVFFYQPQWQKRCWYSMGCFPPALHFISKQNNNKFNKSRYIDNCVVFSSTVHWMQTLLTSLILPMTSREIFQMMASR